MTRPQPLWCTVPGCVFVTAPECMDMTDVLQLLNLHVQSVNLSASLPPSPSSAGTWRGPLQPRTKRLCSPGTHAPTPEYLSQCTTTDQHALLCEAPLLRSPTQMLLHQGIRKDSCTSTLALGSSWTTPMTPAGLSARLSATCPTTLQMTLSARPPLSVRQPPLCPP